MAISREWFINIGGCDCDILDEKNYVNVKVFPACLSTGFNICAVAGVYDPCSNGRHSEAFSDNLKSYIIDAKATLTAKPGGAGQAKFVYVNVYP